MKPGDDQIAGGSNGHPLPEWLELVRQQVASLKFGTVQITVHDARVTQVERVEKVRLDRPAPVRGKPPLLHLTFVPAMSRIFNDITETIGRTPLVRLNRTARKHGAVAEVLLKLEFFNPLSSVKGSHWRRHDRRRPEIRRHHRAQRADRADQREHRDRAGLRRGGARPAIDLTMPETMSLERRKLLKILGAKVVLTEGAKGMKGAIARAEQLRQEIPGSVILQQFSNPSNPDIHRRTTAEEIWERHRWRRGFFSWPG